MFPGKPIHSSINPDEVVAYGAAVFAANLVKYTASHAILVDVTPLSLGVKLADQTVSVVINRNTAIPCKRQKNFTTVRDNQTEATFEVFQGERPLAADNIKLGSLCLKVAPGPQGRAELTATFQIDANGVLHVSTVDAKSGNEVSLVLLDCGGRLSADEVKGRIEEAKTHAQSDAERVKTLRVLQDVETLLYWIEYFLFNMESDISEMQIAVAKAAQKTVEKWMKANKVNASLAEATAKHQELKTVYESLFNADLVAKAKSKRDSVAMGHVNKSQTPGERILQTIHFVKAALLPKLNAAEMKKDYDRIQQAAWTMVDTSVGGV